MERYSLSHTELAHPMRVIQPSNLDSNRRSAHGDEFGRVERIRRTGIIRMGHVDSYSDSARFPSRRRQ
jgi:hypothetical protein